MEIQDLLSKLEPWAKIIEEWDDVIRVYYVPNPDAVVSGAIFGRVFLDLEIPCVISSIDQYQSKESQNKKPSIILGISLADLEKLEIQSNSIVILQLDEYKRSLEYPENVIDLSDWIELDENITISAISYFLCNPIAKTLDYIVRLPLLSFFIKFKNENFTGLHDLISKDAIEGGIANLEKRFIFLGPNIFTIPELLEYSQYPFLPGLSGNEANVNNILTKSGIELVQGNKTRKIGDLSKPELTELNSRLVLFMSTQKGHQEDEMTFIRDTIIFQDEEKKGISSDLRDFARSIIDAVHRNQISLGIAVLMGNRSNKLLQLQKLFIEERKAISVSFQILTDHGNEIEDLGALRLYNSDRKVSWYNTSLTAGMALSNGLVKPDKPFAVISPGPGENVTIGFRASKLHKIGDGLKSLLESVALSLDYPILVLNGSKLSSTVSVEKSISREILLSVNNKLLELGQ